MASSGYAFVTDASCSDKFIFSEVYKKISNKITYKLLATYLAPT